MNDSVSLTRLYGIFSGMKQRCYNPSSPAFKYYGAKGIEICPEWMGEHGVSSFFEWALHNGYEEHLTIDRIDAKGHYSPDNCRWITREENSQRVDRPQRFQYAKKPGLNYKINVLAALKEKGYNTTRLRQEKIMGERVIQQLRRNEIVSWGTIEKLCSLLNCQPGDLVEYVPSDND